MTFEAGWDCVETSVEAILTVYVEDVAGDVGCALGSSHSGDYEYHVPSMEAPGVPVYVNAS